MTDTNDSWPVHSPEPAGLRAKARLALARRDLLEFIRDRRTLFVTLLLPMAMYPVLALSSALGVRTALSDIDARQAPTNLGVVLSGSPWDVRAFAQRVETLSQPDEGPGSRDWPASITFGFASAEEARKTVEAGRAKTRWRLRPTGLSLACWHRKTASSLRLSCRASPMMLGRGESSEPDCPTACSSP